MNHKINAGLERYLKSYQDLVKNINSLDGSERASYILGLGIITEQMREIAVFAGKTQNKAVIDEIIGELELQLDSAFEDSRLDSAEQNTDQVMFNFPKKGKYEA